MPLDHYVSQVHLRNFYSPHLDGGMMYAIKKGDLKQFPCKSADVCRIEDGSTNAYLKEDRAIEEFLKTVEPIYNVALSKVIENKIDAETIYVIAGFVSYVVSCAPAAMRIHQEPLQKAVETTAAILEAKGALPKAPPELGGKSLTELLEEGTVNVKVDPKYPQALGISTIIQRVSLFGNSRWEVLINNNANSPFFTSDFPVAMETGNDPRVLNRIVPLAPTVAIRIVPDINLAGAPPDLRFAKFSHTRKEPRHQDVSSLNRLIVRCAEDVVFYRDKRDWVLPFVSKNRGYRIEPTTLKIPHGTGFLNWSTQRIQKVDQKT